MASSCVCTSPLAVVTVVGLLDVVTVYKPAEFKSFLLIMCIDTPESTTNSLSSGLRVEDAGRHLFSEGEKNAVLSFSFNFWDIFGQPPTSLLPFRLFLRPILKFWSIGVTLMRITWANHFKRWIFGLECQHDVPRLWWIEHIGLVSVCLSSSAKSMKTSAAPHLEIRNPIGV